MNDNAYSEFVNVDESSVQIFAMLLDTDKIVWSISSTTHSVSFNLGDNSADAIKTLKEMRKKIDGAIKFMNEKQKQIDVAKGKNNDAGKK